MISSDEYNILKSLKQSPEIDENRYYNEIRNLLSLKMIEYNVTGETERNILYNGFIVTPMGEAAIEEYERMLKNEKREDETLKVAHEANDISRHSNKLSKLAVALSIVAIVVSIVGIIVGAVTPQT